MSKVETLDLTKIKVDVKDKLIEHLDTVQKVGFEEQTLLRVDWDAVDLADALEFEDDGSLDYTVVDDTTATPVNKKYFPTNEEGDAQDTEDKIYVPIIAQQKDGWVGHTRRVLIPTNRRFYDMKFHWRKTLSKQYPFLVPVFEDGWKRFLNTSFDRIGEVSKIVQGIVHLVMYANVFTSTDYDPDYQLVTTSILNNRDCCVYPAKGDPRKASYCNVSYMPIQSLREMPDIDQELLSQIQADKHIKRDDGGEAYNSGSNVPYGHLKVATYFIPGWECDDVKVKYDKKQKRKIKEEGTYELKNALILVAEDVKLKENKTIDDKLAKKYFGESHTDKVILSIVLLPSKDHNPFLLSTFEPTTNQAMYAKSKLAKYLGYQEMGNMIATVAWHGIPIKVFPPLKISGSARQKPPGYFKWAPRAGWPMDRPDDVQPMEVTVDVGAFIEFATWVERTAAKGMGITELLQGISANPSSRKTATEALEERKSGEVKVDFAAEWMNDTYLKLIVWKNALITQQSIEEEVEDLRKLWDEENRALGKKAKSNADFWKFVREESELYRNFLNFSGIIHEIEKHLLEMQRAGNKMTAQAVEQEFDYGETLYQAIIEPIQLTDVIVDGSTSEITRREAKQDFVDLIGIYKGLPLLEMGWILNIKAIDERAAKLFNEESGKYVIKLSDAIQENPALGQQLAAKGIVAPGANPNPLAQPPLPTPEGARGQIVQEETPLEEPEIPEPALNSARR